MSKILISGVAGLLGSHLSRHFISKGHTVIGIDNFFGGYADFVDENVVLHVGDLSNKWFVSNVFKEIEPEYVYHLAAYAAVGLSPFIRNYNYTNNVLCSVNLINESINYNTKKFIFTSSMDVYGWGNPPFDETQLPSPISPYGIAKYAVEQDLKQANEQFGLRYSIIRPHNVVGIYQNIWDRYRNVIGIWIRQVLNNQPITIYGDGTNRRAFSDIKFYMDPFERLMYDHDGEIFNIGADKDFSLNEVAETLIGVANKIGYDAKVVHLEPRLEVSNAYCNHDKAKKMLSFEDTTDLETLIEEMFAWAALQPNREVKNMDYEINKGIYSYWK